MSLFTIQTEQGQIGVSRAVIEQIILEVMKPLEGKAWLSNPKGRTVSKVMKLSGANEVDYMEMNSGAEGLELRMYIVVKLGTSIKSVTGQIIEQTQDQLTAYLGKKAAKLTVVVAGVASARTARRRIEVNEETGATNFPDTGFQRFRESSRAKKSK